MIRKPRGALALGLAVAVGCATMASASAKSPARIDRRWDYSAAYLDRPVLYRPEIAAWNFGGASSRAEFNGRPFGYGLRPLGWPSSYLR